MSLGKVAGKHSFYLVKFKITNIHMEINSKIMYYLNKTLLSLEPWELRPKKFQTNVAVSPAPVRVPSQSPLAPSVASVTSVVNDKDDN